MRGSPVLPLKLSAGGAAAQDTVKIGLVMPMTGTLGPAGQEAVADIDSRNSRPLKPVQVSGGMAAEMIDELPVLAVAATQMPGRSVIAGAGELRVKESNRIVAMEQGLAAMGADITATEDGWVINGPRELEGTRVSAHSDHRVAMALAVAGLIAEGRTEIDGAECVEISYPEFFDHLE